MATTQRYFPSGYTAIDSSGVAWVSGSHWLTPSTSDYARCTLASGQYSQQFILRDFGISIPAGQGITDIKIVSTGSFIGSAQDAGQVSFQLYDGSGVFGTAIGKTWDGVAAQGIFSGASTRHQVSGSNPVWGTHVSLTNTLVATTGFGVAVSGVFNQPPASFGFTPSLTGIYNMASFALDVTYDATAKLRNNGTVVSRLGSLTIKQ
jgi:hypothetical protein